MRGEGGRKEVYGVGMGRYPFPYTGKGQHHSMKGKLRH